MSSIAFPGSAPSNVTQMQATARTGPATAEPAPAPDEDTVTLSASAQAEAMYQGGQSVSSIAASLGTSEQLVDSYLSITPSVAVPVSAAPAAHSAPAAHAAPATPAAPAAPAAQATPDATPELPKAVAKG
jgi:3-hydroxy-3-methylglutaryl CoA synthase